MESIMNEYLGKWDECYYTRRSIKLKLALLAVDYSIEFN